MFDIIPFPKYGINCRLCYKTGYFVSIDKELLNTENKQKITTQNHEIQDSEESEHNEKEENIETVNMSPLIVSCPLCGHHDDTYIDVSDIYMPYCMACGIVFQIGCLHAVNFTIGNIYYAKLIQNFTYNGSVFNGMPKFNSFDEACKFISKIKFNFVCLCNKNCFDDQCKKAQYGGCELVKCYCIYD